jgi:O-antigen/teichoic acid export membrane protein
MALGRERAWVKIGLIAAVLNVVCNLVAIPALERYTGNGATGASIATVVTEAWMFGGALMLIPRRLLDSRLVWQTLGIVIAALAAAAIAAAALQVAFVLAAMAGVITYVALVLTLRVCSVEDLHHFTNKLRRRGAVR